jgi:hypothetical protein
MKHNEIERQGPAGNWIAVNADDAEKYIALVASRPRHKSIEAVMSALESGQAVRYDTEWYQNIRMVRLSPAPAPVEARPRLVCRKCGTIGFSGSHPFSTISSSGICDDCL